MKDIKEALDKTLTYLNYVILKLEDNGKVDEAKSLYNAYIDIKEKATAITGEQYY